MFNSATIADIRADRGAPPARSRAYLGLSEKEKGRYSLVRAIAAASVGKLPIDAPFELECSKEVERRVGQFTSTADSIFVPEDQFRGERAMTAGVAGAGGYLIETENWKVFDYLFARSVAFRLGAYDLSGCVGNMNLPRVTTAVTSSHQGTEVTTTGESDPTIKQVIMTPKNASAYTELSRNLLLLSSPGVEGVVSRHIGSALATLVDAGTINGTGYAGQPLGLLNTTGITSQSGSSATITTLINPAYNAAAANLQAPAGFGYAADPASAKLLKTRSRFASYGDPLWAGSLLDGSIEGHRAIASTQLPANTMLAGDWTTLVIASWGILEIQANPFDQVNFQKGVVGIGARIAYDVGCLAPQLWTVTTSIS